ncbi:MAG: hypothetical protein PHQ36_10795, partial [Anaerolineales bacterium]|nr:hypothetical protein [Anaerolineales bacterium]
MSKPSAPRQIFLYAALIFALIYPAAACTLTLPSAASLDIAPTPISARPFGYAEIAKPTYTASPTAIPTATQTATQTPISIAQVEILEDTPTPEYIAPALQDSVSIAPI